MTITFSPSFDYATNEPELVKHEVEECICVFEGQASEECTHCKGSGKHEFTIYPFEVNMTSGNASTLFSALGITLPDCSGVLDPLIVSEAISKCIPGLAVRGVMEGIRSTNCCLDEDYVIRRFSSLKDMCVEAIKRGVNIVYG
jgi:hypothetical protein